MVVLKRVLHKSQDFAYLFPFNKSDKIILSMKMKKIFSSFKTQVGIKRDHKNVKSHTSVLCTVNQFIR